MKEKKRFLRIIMVPVLLFTVSCSSGVKTSGELKGLPEGMFPDYSEVTVPCNIAPLDFSVGDGGKAFLEINAPGGDKIAVKSGKYGFRIPLRKWRNILEASKGGSLEFTVAVLRDGKWLSYEPFKVNVSEYEADPYVAYRLIAPGYGLEGALPDATCKHIVEREMIPKFKENDYCGGINKALDVIIPIVKGEYSSDEYEKYDKAATYIVIGFFVVFIIVVIVFSRGGGGTTYSSGGTYTSSRPSYWGGSSSWSGGSSSGFGGFGGGSFGGGGAGGSW